MFVQDRAHAHPTPTPQKAKPNTPPHHRTDVNHQTIPPPAVCKTHPRPASRGTPRAKRPHTKNPPAPASQQTLASTRGRGARTHPHPTPQDKRPSRPSHAGHAKPRRTQPTPQLTLSPPPPPPPHAAAPRRGAHRQILTEELSPIWETKTPRGSRPAACYAISGTKTSVPAKPPNQ